jgi:uncharacterized protein YjbI with pentapeptide repeats
VGRKKPRRRKDKQGFWPSWSGFRGKTVWDWLPILGTLAIPIMIAVGTWWITWQQGNLEHQRAQGDREVAEQRAQDEALQAYLDQMSQLLLKEDLRSSEVDSEVRTLVRARTLTALSRLDPSRRASIVRFLREADLIQSKVNSPFAPSDAGQSPFAAALEEELEEERNRNLGYAPVISLYQAQLDDTNLTGADLGGADLRGADLSGADLSNAELTETSLYKADLSGTDLGGAYLAEADLRGATGWTKAQLEAAESLEGATMPNGQKYEDWLKSKGSVEDGGNTSPS